MPRRWNQPLLSGAGCGAWLLALLLAGTLPADPAAERNEQPPSYPDHDDLTYYLDREGRRHAIESVDDWAIRKRHIRANLQLVMGRLPEPRQRVELDVRQTETAQLGRGIERRKISYQADPHDRVAAWLFLPARPAGGKLPAVLCLQQTTSLGKDEPAGLGGHPDQHYALHLAERGYITLAPDYPSFGEHDYDFDPRHGYASGSMKAVWDNMRAVDALASLAEVDVERIGCIGHSLGGHSGMFTAAFDERIQVLVSSCGFSSFAKDDMPSWTGPRYMPRIASVYRNDPALVPFDFAEIVGCFAPRPFLASAALHDSDFDVSGVRDVMAAALAVYELHGVPEHLGAYYPDSEHAFPADARRAAYEFLDRHLK